MTDINKLPGFYHIKPANEDGHKKHAHPEEHKETEAKPVPVETKHIDPDRMLELMSMNNKPLHIAQSSLKRLVPPKMQAKYGSTVSASIKEFESLVDKGIIPTLDRELEFIGHSLSNGTKQTVSSLSSILLQ